MKRHENEFAQQRLNLDGAGLVETVEAVSLLEDGVASEQTDDFQSPAFYTVGELTEYLENVLAHDAVLGGTVVVKGEVSNTKRSSRGHVYFTLKDTQAALSGILWAGLAKNLPFALEDGQEVFVTGRLEIYAPSGTYSLVASRIEPVGTGALQLALQQLRQQLEAEGLFLPEFKKPLPDFPERIGIVTSRTGAVIHDMLRVIRRKNPFVDVLLLPVKVQGDGAALEIAAAIRELNHPAHRLDVLIVARGGGSFEDLFCFNEEPVVRAIFNSMVPVITGIGHQPDYTLADAAADESASTPTAAAERVVPDFERLLQDMALRKDRLKTDMINWLAVYEQQFDKTATRFIESFEHALDLVAGRLENTTHRLVQEATRFVQMQEQKFTGLVSELDAFNPLATLARGYAIVTTRNGRVVSSVGQVQAGDVLDLKLSDGELQCEVLENA